MERISVKCTNCGHVMDIDPKIIAFRCSNCGTRIDLDDGSPLSKSKVHNTFTHIADRIAEDRERERRLRQREREEYDLRRREEEAHPFKHAITSMAPLLIIMGILLLIGAVDIAIKLYYVSR